MSAVLDATVRAGSRSIRLTHSMPGFPEVRVLEGEPWGGPDSPFVVLSAVGVEVRFVVASPGLFFPDYDPVLPADTLADLGVAPASAQVWTILTLGPTPADTTANLLGPLVVNPATGRARQVVLAGSRWSPRTPIVAAARSI